MDKTLVGMSFVFFLAFTLFATLVLLRSPIATFTRAKEDIAASGTDSLIFAWPLQVKPDGTDKSEITVFVRSATGKGLSDKLVTVNTSLGKLQALSPTTDKDGKSTFRFTSTQQGIAEIEAIVDNIKIQRSISIKVE